MLVFGAGGYLLTDTFPFHENLMFTLAAGALGAIVPYSYASRQRNRRFQKFEEEFPEAIDTLARAVRAGHAFTMAVEILCNELAEPVATEFRKLFEEQKYGMPVRDALLNLAERMPLMDVKFFVTAVMLQRETGGNLAEILDNLSYMIRERFKILRQVRVYTAQGRLTMMLLMAVPPLIVVTMLFLNPSFIRALFDDPIGHLLLVLRHPEDHSDPGLSHAATNRNVRFCRGCRLHFRIGSGRLRALIRAQRAPAGARS